MQKCFIFLISLISFFILMLTILFKIELEIKNENRRIEASRYAVEFSEGNFVGNEIFRIDFDTEDGELFSYNLLKTDFKLKNLTEMLKVSRNVSQEENDIISHLYLNNLRSKILLYGSLKPHSFTNHTIIADGRYLIYKSSLLSRNLNNREKITSQKSFFELKDFSEQKRYYEKFSKMTINEILNNIFVYHKSYFEKTTSKSPRKTLSNYIERIEHDGYKKYLDIGPNIYDNIFGGHINTTIIKIDFRLEQHGNLLEDISDNINPNFFNASDFEKEGDIIMKRFVLRTKYFNCVINNFKVNQENFKLPECELAFQGYINDHFLRCESLILNKKNENELFNFCVDEILDKNLYGDDYIKYLDSKISSRKSLYK